MKFSCELVCELDALFVNGCTMPHVREIQIDKTDIHDLLVLAPEPDRTIQDAFWFHFDEWPAVKFSPTTSVLKQMLV